MEIIFILHFLPTSSTMAHGLMMTMICAHDTWEHKIYILCWSLDDGAVGDKIALPSQEDSTMWCVCIVVGCRPINRTYCITSTK